MNPRSYIVPSVLLALAVHALVVVVLVMNWNRKPHIEIARAQQYYIKAELVARNPYTVRKEEQERAAANERARRQRIEQERQAAEERAKLAQQKLEQQRRAQLAREQAQKEDQAQLIQQVVKEQRADKTSKAAAERKRQEDLSLAVLNEQNARQAVTNDEKAMAYVQQIKRVIIQNWSRPPSARNGMQATLKVHLVPDGEVVNVTVVKSSGNDAFDRSAILAVQKAQRFDVPSDPRLFERYFREFEVLFRPEDLRL